uniref:Phospholipid-transporting ATPase 1 isoform X2 n=1 Tax=Rhizophora mucronata TaxID=61149 RepID=A0A2P2MSE7_RHIMU
MELNEKILGQESNQGILAGLDLIPCELVLVTGSPRIIYIDEPGILFPQYGLVKLHTFVVAPPLRLA